MYNYRPTMYIAMIYAHVWARVPLLLNIAYCCDSCEQISTQPGSQFLIALFTSVLEYNLILLFEQCV